MRAEAIGRDGAWAIAVRAAENDPLGPVQVDYVVANEAEVGPCLDYLESRIRIGQKGPGEMLRLYIETVATIPGLTPDEEAGLGRAVELGRLASAERSDDTPRSPDRDSSLRERANAGEDAKQRLIKANLYLVLSIAQTYRIPGRSMNDLVQEGNLGLQHAAEHFNWRSAETFSMQATPWIHEAITDSP
jgi:DNA-directed RNA polymerase sigma subunit (sigma70/sigma32)